MVFIKRLLSTAILMGALFVGPSLAQASLAPVNEDYVLLNNDVITVSDQIYLPIKEVMAGAGASVVWGADSQDKILVVADGKRYQINLSIDDASGTVYAGTSDENTSYLVQIKDGHAYFTLDFYKEVLNRDLTYVEAMSRLNYIDMQPIWWDSGDTQSNVNTTIKNLEPYTVDEVSRSAQPSTRATANVSANGGIPIDHEQMVWPTTATRISSPYGSRGGGFHSGVDIDGDTGDDVYAAWTGKVTSAGWSGGYGNVIDILHADGTVTRYAHLDQILTRVGTIVNRGDVIATEGSTGRSTGDHLHFEVRKGKMTFNPLDYISTSRRV